MTTAMPSTLAVDDVIGAELGDARRTKRLAQLVGALSVTPALSLPDALSEAELEAAYRLMSNDDVSFEAIVDAQNEKTAERCAEADVTLVLHDTTEFSFALRDGVYRENLSNLSSRRQGFYLHASLAVSGDGDRRPLGIIAARPYVHLSGVAHDAAARAFWTEHDGVLANENTRWFESVTAAELELEAVNTEVVHVADREGDSYLFLASMASLDFRFVVRANQDRSIEDDDEVVGRMRERLDREEFFSGQREVSLSPRTATRSASALKTHPARTARTALLSFRACTMTIKRPAGANHPDYLPDTITLTAVEAVERNPPSGQESVQWLLLTTERCETIDDALGVVDWYRARWVIEEFFKALKTGCSYEARQFSTAHALLNMLAVTLPIATQLLALRHLSRHRPEAEALIVFTSQQLSLLAALLPKANITAGSSVHDALMAVAKLGGHLKRNGAPGWLVLYRGYARLHHAEAGWQAMRSVGEV
ncbi:MAG: IS4 family transposase [bacterium]|nr:IS4 family transposase [bacterium]